MFAYSDKIAVDRRPRARLAGFALPFLIVTHGGAAVAQALPSSASADAAGTQVASDAVAPQRNGKTKRGPAKLGKKIGLTLSPILRVPIRPMLSGAVGDGQSWADRSSDAGAVIALTASYAPSANWLIQASVYRYLNKAKRRPWDADFSYAFGYVNYRPHTFSLTYSNYSANRFSPEPGQPVTRIGSGTVSGSWSFEAPREIQLDAARRTSCRLGYNVQPGFRRGATARRWKQAASLGCSYPLWKRLYVAATGYLYTNGEKDSSNPDFTYSFGWADWRPGGFSIQYSNYAGNRFPWDKSKGNGGFGRGTVSIGWSAAF